MTDYELLFEYKIGQQTIKECSGITFLGWVANKINGLRTNIPGLNELAM